MPDNNQRNAKCLDTANRESLSLACDFSDLSELFNLSYLVFLSAWLAMQCLSELPHKDRPAHGNAASVLECRDPRCVMGSLAIISSTTINFVISFIPRVCREIFWVRGNSVCNSSY